MWKWLLQPAEYWIWTDGTAVLWRRWFTSPPLTGSTKVIGKDPNTVPLSWSSGLGLFFSSREGFTILALDPDPIHGQLFPSVNLKSSIHQVLDFLQASRCEQLIQFSWVIQWYRLGKVMLFSNILNKPQPMTDLWHVTNNNSEVDKASWSFIDNRHRQ